MKKAVKIFLVLLVFLSFNQFAIAKNELRCGTVTIECANGKAGYGLVCGSTDQEIIDAGVEMGDVICNA